jgi:hypothetical protein
MAQVGEDEWSAWVIHHEKHKSRSLPADLEADAAPFKRHH